MTYLGKELPSELIPHLLLHLQVFILTPEEVRIGKSLRIRASINKINFMYY